MTDEDLNTKQTIQSMRRTLNLQLREILRLEEMIAQAWDEGFKACNSGLLQNNNPYTIYDFTKET